MAKEVRVRFAPSPTGALHIGGVRTALYNYLFAKHHNGKFLLRIEDTDQTRFVEAAEQYIIDSLKWLGLTPDEGVGFGGELGPYRQSERKEIYKGYVEELLANGKAYYAFDTAEELDTARAKAEENKETFIYNWSTRGQLKNSLSLSKEETQALLDANTPYVVRFMIEDTRTVLLDDMIRGKISIDASTLDDKVLFKSDGMPTYHLANIVDDHLMEITHVIRGEEWLPSMALHELLYDAFGWEAPRFAHLPLILKPEGKGKLSKRDGDKHGFPVFPMEWKTEEGIAKGYKQEGYFPDAVLNMLALLGWSSGTDQEIYTMDELIEQFSLEKVSKSGARFSPDKAVWFNNQYLQQKSAEELLPAFQEVLKTEGVELNNTLDIQVIELLKERANFVKDIFEQGKFFYTAPTSYDEKAAKKAWKDDSKEILTKFIEVLNSTEFNAEILHDAMANFVTAQEIGFGKIGMPLRLSLVGALQGPDVPVIMAMLGKDETIARINKIIETLEA
ncbi:glutamate--tRNA ligase [Faecalibacter rhinopitheci]|uniref:Glutamate--tRNA ligase n=1 Tax=Faecalibacter rhinopitheci TaxID=2779678 RepID=A0A8J7KAN9_9FLAO|nr:glutamate--tRNA ligase [Faecalibacter rhinopitheci]MBF0597745.1 glutamate--tRNA ligase [Faecalibacter rhinopitheci]